MSVTLKIVVAGLSCGVSTWVLLMLVTLGLRKELKARSKVELNEARSREGYNATSFLGRKRDSITSDDDVERRELKATASGIELGEINRAIRTASFIVFVMVIIIAIVLRFAC
ncbi:hypothetical protein IKG06_02600 [Candidatus Saccharibacteria bacterium]|nr:hypothetical protein [Candidatus Saccharibacteria bacterium]